MKIKADTRYEIRLFEEKYREDVIEHSYYSCISLLDEDFNHMFIILKDGKYEGFGFVRVNGVYAELNGPFYIKLPDEETQKEVIKHVLKGIKNRYKEKKVYFFTDYPETFENMGCEIAYEAPPEVLLKAVPG